MKIRLVAIGKTSERYLQTGIDEYAQRLQHYTSFEFVVLPDIKNARNLSEQELKHREGTELLRLMDATDFVVLLDEKGTQYTSTQFAQAIQKWLNARTKRCTILIGGAYGFSPEVYARAQSKISLSQLTYSHQMVRLIIAEQLYRAHTILKGEPYHHE